MRPFVMFYAILYFLEYAIRSSPAVTIPELSQLFGASSVGVSTTVGTYYYTYVATSLVAGVSLDHCGGKYVIPARTFVFAFGCAAFALPHPLAEDTGRVLRGAGSAFAFIDAVYLATQGLPAYRYATPIGVTLAWACPADRLGKLE